MKPKTQELLYLALWTYDTLSRPTFRNLTESFEGWAYRNGLLRQLHRLERRQWLESQTGPAGCRLHRLTDAGRLQAMGGRDPEACWRRSWDGRWRVVLFDVPETRSSTRNKLRRYLRSRGFGYLQNSAWITPDPVDRERAILADGPVDVESLILLEARPCTGESDADIVAGAWDFDEINQGYNRYREILLRRPHRRLDTEAAANGLHRWLGEERVAWLEMMDRDPLLPQALLPAAYAGRRVWRLRREIMAEVGEQMRRFKPA
jgi:phenylacetic acid degradation operon negative regulatory protein